MAKQSRDKMSLNQRASEVFVRVLLNPPTPGKRLLAAAKRYRQRMKAFRSRVSS